METCAKRRVLSEAEWEDDWSFLTTSIENIVLRVFIVRTTMHFTLLAPPILTNLRMRKICENFQVLKLSVSIALHLIDQSLPNYKHVGFIFTSTRDTQRRLDIFINATDKLTIRSHIEAFWWKSMFSADNHHSVRHRSISNESLVDWSGQKLQADRVETWFYSLHHIELSNHLFENVRQTHLISLSSFVTSQVLSFSKVSMIALWFELSTMLKNQTVFCPLHRDRQPC